VTMIIYYDNVLKQYGGGMFTVIAGA
jgi:hypothetical protein